MSRPLVVLFAMSLAACSSSSSDDPSTDASAEAAAGGAGGSGGSAGTGGQPVPDSGMPDASVDASIDVVMDVATDPLADAPPRPAPTDPLQIVLFGSLGGLDFTGIYDLGVDAGAAPDVCGPGFEVERQDAAGTSASVRWSNPMTSNPPVGTYDQLDAFDFTVSRFMRVDGSLRQVTVRAGEVAPESLLTGDVLFEDLDAASSIETQFVITRAEVFGLDEGPDAGTQTLDGELYFWATGTCR